jgi:hypothetical protein
MKLTLYHSMDQGMAINNFISDCSVYWAQAVREGQKDPFVKAVCDAYLYRFPVARERGDDDKLHAQRVQHVKDVSAHVLLPRGARF